MICFYHAGCLDGLWSAQIVRQCYEEKANNFFIPIQYDDPLPDLAMIEGKVIFIVDFSFPLPIMQLILKHARRVIWIDHHKTAIRMYEEHRGVLDREKHLEAILDDSHSGAWLTWTYFRPDEAVPIYIEHAEDQDLYTFKKKGTEAFHRYALSKPLTLDGVESIKKGIEEGHYREYLAIGESLIQAHKNNMQWASQFVHPITILGKTYTAVNGHRQTISDLGSEIAKQHFVGVVYFIEGKRVKISLRSDKEARTVIDVEAIANSFPGGGGHLTAASFYVTLKEFTAMVYGPEPKESLLDRIKGFFRKS